MSCGNSPENTNSVQFNYEVIKEKFNYYIHKTCPKTMNLVNPFWVDTINFVIKTILDGKKAIKNSKAVEYFAFITMQKYDIIEKNGKDVLVLKKTDTDGEKDYLLVVSSEECFDLLVYIHLENNHANKSAMMEILNEKYFLKEQHVNVFLKLCNVCNPKENIFSANVYNAYYVFTIDLLSYRDGSYRYLLVLLEVSTGYIHLRPLVTRDIPEVAIEMFKIYTDFSPPILINTPESRLFKAVNEYIGTMCQEFTAPVEEESKSSDIEKLDELIKLELCEWMKMTGSDNWATGCRMVQWRINNIEKDDKTPYQNLFGVVPNDILYANPVWLRITDLSNETITRKICEFKELFNLKVNEESESDSLLINLLKVNNNKDANEDVEASTSKQSGVPQCVICLHPVYRLSHCTQCHSPMHPFCGTRFAHARNKTIHNLCLKCKKSE